MAGTIGVARVGLIGSMDWRRTSGDTARGSTLRAALSRMSETVRSGLGTLSAGITRDGIADGGSERSMEISGASPGTTLWSDAPMERSTETGEAVGGTEPNADSAAPAGTCGPASAILRCTICGNAVLLATTRDAWFTIDFDTDKGAAADWDVLTSGAWAMAAANDCVLVEAAPSEGAALLATIRLPNTGSGSAGLALLLAAGTEALDERTAA